MRGSGKVHEGANLFLGIQGEGVTGQGTLYHVYHQGANAVNRIPAHSCLAPGSQHPAVVVFGTVLRPAEGERLSERSVHSWCIHTALLQAPPDLIALVEIGIPNLKDHSYRKDLP